MGVFFDEGIVISRTSDRFSQELRTLCIDKDFTDFTLKTGAKEVDCHRVIIAANSPVLKGMLRSQMKETIEKQIELNNISPEAMENIVEYMYSGQITIYEEDTLMDIMEAADFLLMDELKQMCIQQACALLQPSNVIIWSKFSTKLDLTELYSACSKVMVSKLQEIKSGEDFLELNISELKSYIQDLKKNEADPNDLLIATLDWMNADPKGRGHAMKELLEVVPPEQCHLPCLEEVEEKYDSLLETCKVFDRIVECIVFYGDNELTREARPAKKSDFIHLVVGGCAFSYKNPTCFLIDSSFSEFCNLPLKFLHVDQSICKTPKGFILTGGQDSDDAAIYDIKSNSMKRLPSLLKPRHAHGSAFVKNQLFIFGGEINGLLSKSVHYLDEGGSWQAGPDIPTACYLPQVVSMGEDDVFLMDTFESNGLFKLNVTKKLWSNLASLPGDSSDYGARLIQVDDRLCLVGGDNCTLAWYTPSTDSWSRGAELLLRHTFPATMHHEDTILILGGEHEVRVEAYDMNTGEWSICDRVMPMHLQDHHCFKFPRDTVES